MGKHFFNMQVDTIDRNGIKNLEGEKSRVLFKNKDSIPEGDNIKLFQGIFSQNFGKGEKSRNGYKYDQEGWIVDNYARNPLMLWQHDDSYGGIGLCQELYIDTKGNLQGIFYVDLDMLDDRNRKQVEKGYVKMVSTGAISQETMYEHNETGKRYTKDEAIKEFSMSDIFDCLYGAKDAILTYVVTKAELVENSLVTIGSNFGAIAKSVNNISDEMETIANGIKSKQDKNILISKDSTMNLDEAKKEIDTLNDKVKALGNDVSEKDTKIDTLNDDISKKADKIESLEKQIDSLKGEVEKSDNNVKKLEDEAREKILAEVKVDNNAEETKKSSENAVKTAKDFVAKYSK